MITTIIIIFISFSVGQFPHSTPLGSAGANAQLQTPANGSLVSPLDRSGCGKDRRSAFTKTHRVIQRAVLEKLAENGKLEQSPMGTHSSVEDHSPPRQKQRRWWGCSLHSHDRPCRTSKVYHLLPCVVWNSGLESQTRGCGGHRMIALPEKVQPWQVNVDCYSFKKKVFGLKFPFLLAPIWMSNHILLEL